MNMPRALRPGHKPTWQQIEIAIEWLRKNDVDDAYGIACQKTANMLEARIKTVKATRAHRAALLALDEARMQR